MKSVSDIGFHDYIHASKGKQHGKQHGKPDYYATLKELEEAENKRKSAALGALAKWSPPSYPPPPPPPRFQRSQTALGVGPKPTPPQGKPPMVSVFGPNGAPATDRNSSQAQDPRAPPPQRPTPVGSKRPEPPKGVPPPPPKRPTPVGARPQCTQQPTGAPPSSSSSVSSLGSKTFPIGRGLNVEVAKKVLNVGWVDGWMSYMKPSIKAIL